MNTSREDLKKDETFAEDFAYCSVRRNMIMTYEQ